MINLDTPAIVVLSFVDWLLWQQPWKRTRVEWEGNSGEGIGEHGLRSPKGIWKEKNIGYVSVYVLLLIYKENK